MTDYPSQASQPPMMPQRPIVIVTPGEVDPARALRYHGMVLLAAVAVLAAAAMFGTTPDGGVTDPWFHLRLPELCALKRTTGLDCPGCGLTRCFIAMGHGRWGRALDYHPVGTVMFIVVAAQLPYRVIQLRRLARGKADFQHAGLVAIPALLVTAMVLQWILRILRLIPS